jgi:hypothetical protein
MTPLEEKLRQLSLSPMSRQLETTLTEAATKNRSAAATLERLADMELEAASVHKPAPSGSASWSVAVTDPNRNLRMGPRPCVGSMIRVYARTFEDLVNYGTGLARLRAASLATRVDIEKLPPIRLGCQYGILRGWNEEHS